MDNSKISKIIITFLSICLVISAIFSVTYALLSSEIYAANPEVYSTGNLTIEVNAKSDKISLTNELPKTDEEGLASKPYVFTVRNVGNLDYQFDVKLLSTNTNSFSPDYIKLQIDDGEVITLSSLTDSEIKSDINLFAGEYINISIRIWLDINTPNTELGKSFESEIVTDGRAVTNRSNTLTDDIVFTGNYLTTDIDRSLISSVTFVDNNIVPDTAIFSDDVSYSGDGTVMLWYGQPNSNNLYDIYIGSESGTTKLAIGRYLFSNMTNLTSVDLSNVDTTSVSNMNRMFYGCSKLAELDLNNFNTENVTNMSYMFCNCTSLTTLDLSSFNTPKLLNTVSMFAGCSSLTSLNISNFDTEKVTDMQEMFYACNKLTTLDLSSFITTSLTNSINMFSGCSLLTTLNISKLVTTNISEYTTMFNRVPNNAIIVVSDPDVETWITSNFTNLTNVMTLEEYLQL